MAYKFVNADQLDADLTTVANAIRTKGGTAGQLAFPSGMVSAISAISTGVELNFEVVGNPQPANPKANTIWVNTSTTITDWVFSATQPEDMAEGEVWFPTGTSSAVEFNAIKNGAIMVYPLSAKQMVSGALVNKTAKTWQGGKWVEWSPQNSLYWRGDDRTDLTGGWTKVKGQNANGYATITKNADSVTLSYTLNTGTYGESGMRTVNKINLAGYTSVKANITDFSGGSVLLAVLSTSDNYGSSTLVGYTQIKEKGEIANKLSGSGGEYYVAILCGHPATTFTVNEIWME